MDKKRILKFSRNFLYNLISSLIITVTTTFVVNPVLADRYDATNYGLILTIISTCSVFSNTLGNTLNNVRLVNNNIECEEELKFNYYPILFISSAVSAFLIFLLGIFYYGTNPITSLLLFVYCGFETFRLYIVVFYRVRLNYFRYMIMSLIMAIAYAVTSLLITDYEFWPIIYLSAEICAVLFTLFFGKADRVVLKFSPNVKNVIKSYAILIIAGLVSNIVLYLDKLLIYPVLGSEMVSIYSIASLIGKLYAVVMAPLTGVLLGYFAQRDALINKKIFIVFSLLVISISIIVVLFVPLLGSFSVKLLYPKSYNDANEYIFICSLAAVVSTIPAFINTIILKMCKLSLQLWLNIVYGVLYISLGVIMMKTNALVGFCVASILSSVVRSALLIIVGLIHFKKEEVKYEKQSQF